MNIAIDNNIKTMAFPLLGAGKMRFSICLAKEIAEKLMRGRQRVAAQSGENNHSIFSQYLSVLVIGTQLGFNELQTYTMYQIFDLMERYSLYTNWDIDLRCRLAGGKPDTQPDNWMKNIH